jgi:predicted transcriptional regulator
MRTKSVQIKDDLHAGLREISYKTNKTIRELVDEALAAYIKKNIKK